MKKTIIIIAIVILAFAIGGSSDVLATNNGPKILKVKGLYLGMNLDEGAKIIKKFVTPEFARKLGEGHPLEVTRVPPFGKCNYGFGYFPQGCPKIFLKSDCSEEKKVYYIHIHNDVADKMFDAKGLSQEAFVRLFRDAHNITTKLVDKPESPGDSSFKSWEFERPYGYKVTIDQGHAITIEKVDKKR